MTRLVGRDRELEAIASRLDGASTGHGAVVLVSGEPGIGKTRFLEECAARAADRGFAVVWGRAWEVSSAPPYWPWIEALRAIVARSGVAGELARVLPELGRGQRSTGEIDRFALYDAVVSCLDAAAGREPIVIVLDDLHAADPSSLELAVLVAPRLKRMRAVLLASHRDVEARRDPAIDSALAKLGRSGDTLALRRLDERGVGALVHDAIGREDAETARMIHEASDGNPLFVRELLRLIAERGAAPGDVPAGVRAVIRERLRLLAPATVALLQAAAVVGRSFGIKLAAEVAGVTTSALEEALGDATAMDVLTSIETGRYRFSHALVAETLAGELAIPVRARLHRRAAETLERDHAEDPLAPLAEIAHHWLEAGAEHAAKAVTAAQRAAEAAETRVAFADSAALYERALAALAIADPSNARLRAELLLREGQALVRGGDRARAQEPCVAACEIARGLGDGELFSRAALAFGADVAVAQVDLVLIRLLEEALTLLPAGDGAARARVMARLAAARQPAIDPKREIALALDAIAMARRLDDRRVLGDVMFAAIGALTDFARPEVRAPLNEEVMRMAHESGDRSRELRALQRLAFDRIDLGDLAGFEQEVSRYEALARELNNPRFAWVPMMFRSMRAHWEGRRADAYALAEPAYGLRERFDDPSLMRTRVVRGVMMQGIEDPTRADDAPLAMTGNIEAFARALRGWLACRTRDLAVAQAELAWLKDNALEAIPFHALEMFGQLAWTLRDRTLAARLLLDLEPERGRPLLVTSLGFLLVGIVDHELMRISAVLERWDDVDRYGDSALALCGRLGARPFAARIRADWAEALLDRGSAEALRRASELAAKARAEAVELDITEILISLDAIASRLAGAPAPAHPPTARASITSTALVMCTREGEFWTVSGFGELCRIKDSRGMQMLAKLLESPRQELHALDLAGAEMVDAGDAGELIDRETRSAYTARLKELREELAEAESWNDAGRRERISDEIEALTAELSSAYGAGGRERRTGSATERARQNVRRRLADAMKRIEEACPSVGRHLAITIRTGTTCCYAPDPR